MHLEQYHGKLSLFDRSIAGKGIDMDLYTANMQHNAETVRKFTLLQYNTFEWWRKGALLALSVLLILLGLSMHSPVLVILCLFAGCILLTNSDTRAAAVADGVIEAMHGNFPLLTYSFTEASFSDGKDRPTVPYQKLYRLIADEQYLYLFVSKASGYMVQKVSVEGEKGAEGLMELISQQSGLQWTKPFSLLSFSLRDVLGNHRKSSE